MTGVFNRRLVAVAYDGLCSFEIGVASELFGLPRPELGVEWYDYEVVSVDPGPIRTLGGMTVFAPTDLTRIEAAGTVVLPGWRDPQELPPPALLKALQVANERGSRIMSICSGVFILAASGLLDGQMATTHWHYTDLLASMYPDIDVQPDVLYVDNGATLTSAGSAAGIDLGLHLIRRDYGAAIANQVARRLIVAPHRSGGQAQFVSTPVPPTGEVSMASTLSWAIEHLAESLTVADLADQAAMSPRTFARRFRDEMGVAPHRWLVQQRVGLAQRLLETTMKPIDVVAAESGFVSAPTLRHHFLRATKTTPTGYRASFRVPS